MGRVGTAGAALTGAFPWAGRTNAACTGKDAEVGAGKEPSLTAPWVNQTWSFLLFRLNFWALLAIAMRLHVDFFARVK